MPKLKKLLVASSIAGFCLSGTAFAQQEEQEVQASQCMEDMHVLTLEMQEDGYWLAGYPRVRPPAHDPAADQAIEDPAAPAAGDPVGPWGATGWQYQPQHEMRVLFSAAQVLDRQGDEEACAVVVQAMAQRYQQQIAQLEELGVDPREVAAWRQAEIADAQPAAEAFEHVRVDSLIGMNVRSLDDQNFGDVGDVLLDPQTGELEYVVIARGGFLGIGEDQIVVPWEMLYVTPARTSLVLSVDEAVLDAAPQYDRGGLFDETVTGAIDRESVDSFWAEHRPEQQ